MISIDSREPWGSETTLENLSKNGCWMASLWLPEGTPSKKAEPSAAVNESLPPRCTETPGRGESAERPAWDSTAERTTAATGPGAKTVAGLELAFNARDRSHPPIEASRNDRFMGTSPGSVQGRDTGEPRGGRSRNKRKQPPSKVCAGRRRKARMQSGGKERKGGRAETKIRGGRRRGGRRVRRKKGRRGCLF